MRPWAQFLRQCRRLEDTPGTGLYAAKRSDPELIHRLAELPMAELERRPGSGTPGLRGFTPMHELMSTLTDQVIELRRIVTVMARLKDYQGPDRYVARPDNPVEAAKKLRIKRERNAINDKVERLLNGGGA